MAKYFERQLEELHVQLITLGSYCEKAISFSAKAIQNVQNEEIARQVFETDRDIDAKEREIAFSQKLPIVMICTWSASSCRSKCVAIINQTSL